MSPGLCVPIPPPVRGRSSPSPCLAGARATCCPCGAQGEERDAGGAKAKRCRGSQEGKPPERGNPHSVGNGAAAPGRGGMRWGRRVRVSPPRLPEHYK